MLTNWDQQKKIVTKSIEKLIEMKYITPNPMITYDGMARRN